MLHQAVAGAAAGAAVPPHAAAAAAERWGHRTESKLPLPSSTLSFTFSTFHTFPTFPCGGCSRSHTSAKRALILCGNKAQSLGQQSRPMDNSTTPLSLPLSISETHASIPLRCHGAKSTFLNHKCGPEPPFFRVQAYRLQHKPERVLGTGGWQIACTERWNAG